MTSSVHLAFYRGQHFSRLHNSLVKKSLLWLLTERHVHVNICFSSSRVSIYVMANDQPFFVSTSLIPPPFFPYFFKNIFYIYNYQFCTESFRQFLAHAASIFLAIDSFLNKMCRTKNHTRKKEKTTKCSHVFYVNHCTYLLHFCFHAFCGSILPHSYYPQLQPGWHWIQIAFRRSVLLVYGQVEDRCTLQLRYCNFYFVTTVGSDKFAILTFHSSLYKQDTQVPLNT